MMYLTRFSQMMTVLNTLQKETNMLKKWNGFYKTSESASPN